MPNGLRTSLDFPLPLEPEVLIIVELVDGTAQPDGIVHLPAANKRVATSSEKRAFVNVPMPEAPYEWVSLCGVEGVVYAKGGPFKRSKVCEECVSVGAKPVLDRPAPALRSSVPPLLERKRAEKGKWTRARILEAFFRWRREHGRIPVSTDWMSGVGPDYPTLKTVREVFGCWSDLVVAAGFERPVRGARRKAA